MKKLTFLILVFAVSFAFSADLGLNKIAPTAGVIFPEDDWEMGLQLGAVASIGTVWEGKIGLFPVLSYWASNYEYDWANGDEEITMSNIKIGIDGHYDLSEHMDGLYAGAGIALNRLKIEIPVVTGYSQGVVQYGTDSDTDTEIGFTILAGYNIEISGKPCFIEGQYDIISDLNTFGIKAGMFFDLNK